MKKKKLIANYKTHQQNDTPDSHLKITQVNLLHVSRQERTVNNALHDYFTQLLAKQYLLFDADYIGFTYSINCGELSQTAVG